MWVISKLMEKGANEVYKDVSYSLIGNNFGQEWWNMIIDGLLYVELSNTDTGEKLEFTMSSEAQIMQTMQQYNPYGFLDYSKGGNDYNYLFVVNKQALEFLSLVDSIQFIQINHLNSRELRKLNIHTLCSFRGIDKENTFFEVEDFEQGYATLFDCVHWLKDGFIGDHFWLPFVGTANNDEGPFRMYKISFTDVRRAKTFLAKMATLYSNPLSELEG